MQQRGLEVAPAFGFRLDTCMATKPKFSMTSVMLSDNTRAMLGELQVALGTTTMAETIRRLIAEKHREIFVNYKCSVKKSGNP